MDHHTIPIIPRNTALLSFCVISAFLRHPFMKMPKNGEERGEETAGGGGGVGGGGEDLTGGPDDETHD